MRIEEAELAPSKPDLLFVLPMAASLLLAHFVFVIPEEPGGMELLVIVYAATACFSALLFVPVGLLSSPRDWLLLLRNCALTVTIFVLAVIADDQTRVLFWQLVPIAVMLLLLAMTTLMPLFALRERRFGERPIAFILLAVLFATPVWLGPLVERSGNAPAITNFVVGVSPLSALAVSLDLDYLRTTWFYKNSALGSLRYEYVSWAFYAFTLTTIFALLMMGFAIRAYNRASIFFHKRVAIS